MFNINNFDWPEWFYFGFIVLHLLAMIGLHNKPKVGYWNFWFEFLGVLVMFIIMYFGGFFS